MNIERMHPVQSTIAGKTPSTNGRLQVARPGPIGGTTVMLLDHHSTPPHSAAPPTLPFKGTARCRSFVSVCERLDDDMHCALRTHTLVPIKNGFRH